MGAVVRLQRLLQRIQHDIAQWTCLQTNRFFPHSYALDLGFGVQPSKRESGSEFNLSQIFNGIMWYAVPKNRRSKERRLTRKFGDANLKKYAQRVPIVACLECGHWHEKHTICGNCYSKIKEETKLIWETMGDDLKYQVPTSETIVRYENEDNDSEVNTDNQFVVKMKKDRPEWFSDALLKKVRT